MSSVITLNYTNTLEKILNLSSGATTKGFDSSNTLRNLIHVHGILGQSIIIGVDNETQIKNEEFKKNDDIKDLMIKEQSNLVMKETRHIQCETLINNANVIILFGVSLGDTDARWWKIIGNNLVNRTNIAIIQHLYEPNAIRRTQLQKRGRLEREQQKCFMQKMRIEEKNWSEGHYKIYCVNGNTGFRNESRIFYFIHLQNEEDYERKEPSSAR